MLLASRIAHAVRGLKYKKARRLQPAGESHRSRGAWIEIYQQQPSNHLRIGRIAHAVRGLKLLAAYAIDPVIVSHRSRGAWIEIREL